MEKKYSILNMMNPLAIKQAYDGDVRGAYQAK